MTVTYQCNFTFVMHLVSLSFVFKILVLYEPVLEAICISSCRLGNMAKQFWSFNLFACLMKYLSSQPHGMTNWLLFIYFHFLHLIFHHEHHMNCLHSDAMFVLTSDHKSSVLNFTDLSSSKVFWCSLFISSWFSQWFLLFSCIIVVKTLGTIFMSHLHVCHYVTTVGQQSPLSTQVGLVMHSSVYLI